MVFCCPNRPLVTLYCLNSTHNAFTKEKLNTQYIHYTIAILESAKPLLLNKETKLLLLNKGMKCKELKSEKIKKRKKKRAKAVQQREGLKEAEGKEKELKEEKEEECKAQVLNGDRESEREREREIHLCKFVRKIFSVLQLQDCCNCVAACARDKVSDFSIFFAMYKQALDALG